MRKTLMFVAGAVMAVALMGCGSAKDEPGNADKAVSVERPGSVKDVAEAFAGAVVKREVNQAVDLTIEAAVGVDSQAMRGLKERIVSIGKVIDDANLEAKEYSEEIVVPSQLLGYKIINGAKVTEDAATVVVQFVKEKDRKPYGMKVKLGRVDGRWTVRDFQYVPDGLDTSTK